MGDDSVSQLIGTVLAIGAAAVLLVFVILRNRRSRELNKRLPPGPKPLPILGNLGDMEQLSHQGFAKLSEKYGPLIHLRLGSVHLIVASSVDSAKEILKSQDQNFQSRPSMTPYRIITYDNQSVSSSNGQTWRYLRKVLVAELLTARRMQEFQPMRVEEIKTAVWTIMEESNGGKPVRVGAKVREHLANVLTRMMMSKAYFGPQGSKDSVEFQAVCRGLLDCLGLFHLGDYIPLFKYWDVQGNKKKIRASLGKFDKFLQDVLDERKQQLASKINTGDFELQEKGDFLDVLLTRSVVNDDVKMTETVMKSIIQESLLGGTDSASAAIEWALSELVKHPNILRKAQDELDMIVGKERLVQEDDIPNLHYLQAIVKETFRLHPVTPLLIPRRAKEACEIEGYYIPAGTQALVNVWAIGRDPKLWENPLDFNPDRFLGNPIDLLGSHFELLPFGSGRRICPGLNTGLLDVQYFLAVLIQTCDCSLPPGQTPENCDMTEGIGIVNHRANPLQAVVTRRLPKHIWSSRA